MLVGCVPLKNLLKLSKKWRNIIGSTVTLGGILTIVYFFQSDGLLLTLPFVFFFVWLCPELWNGK